MNITVSPRDTIFLLNGNNFFFLADTVWSAFSNASLEDWHEYLDYRKMQGFNGLQINILPQWDRSKNGTNVPAFTRGADGRTDYVHYNVEYFDKAKKMLEMSGERGFVPALVILWNDYITGKWYERDEDADVMPIEAVEPYTRHVLACFKKFNPIYVLSGDTSFKHDKEKEYYKIAFDTIKDHSPRSLVSMHISDTLPALPEDIVGSFGLDFYMFQSGHQIHAEDKPTEYAEKSCALAPYKPVVNSEPCYEGMSAFDFQGLSKMMMNTSEKNLDMYKRVQKHLANTRVRFDAYDVRRAMWQSVLSGAKAGVAYGAQGLWNWRTHATHREMSPDQYGGSFTWSTALRFEGAWDAVYIKWIFENYDLFDIEPSDQYECGSTAVTMCASRDMSKIIVYFPFSCEITLKVNMEKYKTVLIDLSKKRFITPTLVYAHGGTYLRDYDFNSDAVLVAIKTTHA